MPRLIRATPSYRQHKASGQAMVTIAGRDHYLGPWKSKASKVEYDRLIGEWLAAGRPSFDLESAGESLSVTELVAAYWTYAKGHYVKNGKQTSEVDGMKTALRFLRQQYGHTEASAFGPLGLKALQQQMIAAGHIGIITIVIGFDASQAADEIRSSEFEVVPFKHIVSIEPGRTTYSAVVKQLGEPERVTTKTVAIDEMAASVIDVRTLRDLERHPSITILSYPSRGIKILLPSTASDSVVDSIWVEAPFKGKSENGLHIGMSQKDALSVCERDYFRTMNAGGSCFFALKKGGYDPFQIWFENDQLIRMKLFPSRK